MINEKYIVKVRDLMDKHNLDLPRPKSRIPIITVELSVFDWVEIL